MADLMRADGVQVVRQTLRELGGGRYRVQAFGEGRALTGLTEAGFDVEHVEDVPLGPPAVPGGTGLGPPRRGHGVDERAPLPRRRRGAGRAPGGYLSVAEVEHRIDELTAKYAGAVTIHRPAAPYLGGPRVPGDPDRPRRCEGAGHPAARRCACPRVGEPGHLGRLRRAVAFRLA